MKEQTSKSRFTHLSCVICCLQTLQSDTSACTKEPGPEERYSLETPTAHRDEDDSAARRNDVVPAVIFFFKRNI